MPDPRLTLALEAAARCAQLTLPLFRRGLRPETKPDGTPVTQADRDCERLIRDLITRDFPDDAITGEEFGSSEGPAGYRWYLDPIDGTKTLIAGVPLWGTLIGIEHNGSIIAGVASLPALGELIYASTGEGAWHITSWQQPTESRRRAQVSQTPRLAEALFCYTSAPAFARRHAEHAFESLGKACRTTRGWGDCYGWLLVATGRADLMIDTHIKPWDVAPFAIILPEAGGALTDWRGNQTIHSGEGVASNARILQETLALLT